MSGVEPSQPMTVSRYKELNPYLKGLGDSHLLPEDQVITECDLKCACAQRYGVWGLGQSVNWISFAWNPVGFAFGAAGGCATCCVIGAAKEIGIGEAPCLGESTVARVIRACWQPVGHSVAKDWCDWGPAWAAFQGRCKALEAGCTAVSAGILATYSALYPVQMAPAAGAVVGATPGYYAGRELVYQSRQLIESCKTPTDYELVMREANDSWSVSEEELDGL